MIGGAIVAFALLLAEHMLDLGMERRSLAQSYTSRLTDPAFVDAMVKTADFFRLRDRTADDAWETWRHLDAKSKMHLLEFPNFLDLLATEYCSNRVDRAVVRAIFDPVAVNYWRELNWFIDRFRDDHPNVYKDWETMKNEFEAAKA